MERIIIEGSSHSPEIDFDVNGKLRMEGRSIPENVNTLFDPLIKFVSEMQADIVYFDIKLDYFNTATSKKLLDLLRHIEANSKIGEINITWHFEEGDDDSVEMAELYEECLMRAKFLYKEFAEAA